MPGQRYLQFFSSSCRGVRGTVTHSISTSARARVQLYVISERHRVAPPDSRVLTVSPRDERDVQCPCGQPSARAAIQPIPEGGPDRAAGYRLPVIASATRPRRFPRKVSHVAVPHAILQLTKPRHSEDGRCGVWPLRAGMECCSRSPSSPSLSPTKATTRSRTGFASTSSPQQAPQALSRPAPTADTARPAQAQPSNATGVWQRCSGFRPRESTLSLTRCEAGHRYCTISI